MGPQISGRASAFTKQQPPDQRDGGHSDAAALIRSDPETEARLLAPVRRQRNSGPTGSPPGSSCAASRSSAPSFAGHSTDWDGVPVWNPPDPPASFHTPCSRTKPTWYSSNSEVSSINSQIVAMSPLGSTSTPDRGALRARRKRRRRGRSLEVLAVGVAQQIEVIPSASAACHAFCVARSFAAAAGSELLRGSAWQISRIERVGAFI